MNRITGWSVTLPIQSILVLVVMAVHSQKYEWWLYLLVVVASIRLQIKRN